MGQLSPFHYTQYHPYLGANVPILVCYHLTYFTSAFVIYFLGNAQVGSVTVICPLSPEPSPFTQGR